MCQEGVTLTYLMCSLAPWLFHVHRLSLCTSKTHGCKKLLVVKLDHCHFLFFFRWGDLIDSIKAVTEQEMAALPLFGNNSFALAPEIPRCWDAGWEMTAHGINSRCLLVADSWALHCAAAGGQWGMRLRGWQNELDSQEGATQAHFQTYQKPPPDYFSASQNNLYRSVQMVQSSVTRVVCDMPCSPDLLVNSAFLQVRTTEQGLALQPLPWREKG